MMKKAAQGYEAPLTRTLRFLRAGTVVLGFAVVLQASDAVAACSDSPGPGVDWSGCSKVRKSMKGDDFSEALFKFTDLSRTDFLGAKFVKADLTEAVLYRARLSEADLTDAVLSKVEATRALFQDANLTRTQASKAELLRADFARAVIKETDLSKSELGRASFRQAQLDQVSLRYSNLARADFRESSLNGVDLTGAYTYRTRLEGVDLRQATGLIAVQIELACGDADTQLPPDLSPSETWPCAADD